MSNYYGYYTHELEDTMQKLLDYVFIQIPKDPPEGFRWTPIVELHDDTDIVDIEWVLKSEKDISD